jgi:hypothetical protein
MTVLEHLKQLADNLTPEERHALAEYLTRAEDPGASVHPKSLRGIWRDKFPHDLDINGALNEIRGEWEEEWPEVFRR